MNLKWPSNGSFSANLLILAVGGVVGSGLTWSFRPGGLFGTSSAVFEAAPKTRPSASDTAPVRRSGGPRIFPPPVTEASIEQMSALERGEHFRELGAEAALSDISSALEQSEGITSKKDQLDFLRGVFSEWAENDPEGALSHAQSQFPAGTLQSELTGLAMNKWGYEHPREAWLWAEGNLEGPLKNRALTDLVIGWTRQSPADAAKWLEDSGLTSSSLFTALPRTWAESDPAAALDWVRGLPAGRARDQAKIAVADSFAADDPVAAVKAFAPEIEASSKPATDSPVAATEPTTPGSEAEPKPAVDDSVTSTEGSTPEIEAGSNPDLVVTLTNRWASTDPAAVAEWVNGLPEGQARMEAAATLATVWAARDIQAAIDWSRTIGDAALLQQVTSHLGTTWGAIEPHKALEWLGTLPPDQAAEGTRGAFYSWAATDPVGLEQWIGETAGSPMNDQGRRSLADVRSQSDPAGAMNLALGLSSPEVRDDVMARYYRKWAAASPADAGDWYDMNASKLPPTTRDRLAAETGKPSAPEAPITPGRRPSIGGISGL